MDPLTAQYRTYSRCRLHYGLLFWACLALQFSGIMIVMLTVGYQDIFAPHIIIGLVGLSSFLMAIIAARLHLREVAYENHLRRIEEQWHADGSIVEIANTTGKFSSRKLVVAALFIVGCGLCCYSLVNF